MRADRLLIAVLAIALLGLVPAAPPASASMPTAAGSAPRVALTAPAPDRVRKLTSKIVTRNGGQLFITGVIRPKKGPVVVQKATTCNTSKGTCTFRKFRKAKVNSKGRYRTRVYAPTEGSWAWRAKKGTKVSDAWLTCVRRPGDNCPIP